MKTMQACSPSDHSTYRPPAPASAPRPPARRAADQFLWELFLDDDLRPDGVVAACREADRQDLLAASWAVARTLVDRMHQAFVMGSAEITIRSALGAAWFLTHQGVAGRLLPGRDQQLVHTVIRSLAAIGREDPWGWFALGLRQELERLHAQLSAAGGAR